MGYVEYIITGLIALIAIYASYRCSELKKDFQHVYSELLKTKNNLGAARSDIFKLNERVKRIERLKSINPD